MAIIGLHGLRWPRNRENFATLKKIMGKRIGLYVAFDSELIEV